MLNLGKYLATHEDQILFLQFHRISMRGNYFVSYASIWYYCNDAPCLQRHGSRGKRHYSPSNDSSSRYQRRHRDETFDHSRHSSSRRHVPGPSPVQTHPPQHHHASRANRRRFRRDSTSDSDMDTRNSRLSNKSPPEGYTCGDITPPEIAPPVPPSKDVAMYDTDPDLDKNDLGLVSMSRSLSFYDTIVTP